MAKQLKEKFTSATWQRELSTNQLDFGIAYRFGGKQKL